MILQEVLDATTNSDRIVITDGKQEYYRGFVGNAQYYTDGILDKEVVKMGLFTDIFQKKQRKNKIASTEGDCPLADQVTDMAFRDLEMLVYTKLTIKKGM